MVLLEDKEQSTEREIIKRHISFEGSEKEWNLDNRWKD